MLVSDVQQSDSAIHMCVYIQMLFQILVPYRLSQNIDYLAEGMMLKLKLQYFGHLMWRVDSLEKTLKLGGIGGRRRRGRPRMRWLDGITDSMDMSWVNSGSWWRTGRPGELWFTESQRIGHDWATELNSMRWMKLEPIIQSKVSQIEKHQCSILMHLYGI